MKEFFSVVSHCSPMATKSGLNGAGRAGGSARGSQPLEQALHENPALAEAIFAGFSKNDIRQFRDAVRRMATGVWKVVAVPRKNARTLHEFGIPLREVRIEGEIYEEFTALWVEPNPRMLELIAAYNVGRPGTRKADKEEFQLTVLYAVPGFDDEEVIAEAEAARKTAPTVVPADDLGLGIIAG